VVDLFYVRYIYASWSYVSFLPYLLSFFNTGFKHENPIFLVMENIFHSGLGGTVILYTIPASSILA
jgi:hypothetical protein